MFLLLQAAEPFRFENAISLGTIIQTVLLIAAIVSAYFAIYRRQDKIESAQESLGKDMAKLEIELERDNAEMTAEIEKRVMTNLYESERKDVIRRLDDLKSDMGEIKAELRGLGARIGSGSKQ